MWEAVFARHHSHSVDLWHARTPLVSIVTPAVNHAGCAGLVDGGGSRWRLRDPSTCFSLPALPPTLRRMPMDQRKAPALMHTNGAVDTATKGDTKRACCSTRCFGSMGKNAAQAVRGQIFMRLIRGDNLDHRLSLRDLMRASAVQRGMTGRLDGGRGRSRNEKKLQGEIEIGRRACRESSERFTPPTPPPEAALG